MSNYWERLVEEAPPFRTLEYLKVGDVCRTHVGSPARYIGQGRALYVSCQDNDLAVGQARPPTGRETEFPLPSDEEVARYEKGLPPPPNVCVPDV